MGLQSVSKTLVIDDIIGVQSSKFTNVVGMLTRRKKLRADGRRDRFGTTQMCPRLSAGVHGVPNSKL